MSGARRVYGWALKERLVSENPFAYVSVTVPRKIETRESKAFSDQEALTILNASINTTDTNSPVKAACRWLPWLCAYSGARGGEIAQLRGGDVVGKGDFYSMRLTPEAGTIKTGRPRTVPLHEHLIEQGFITFVQSRGDGPLFYNDSNLPNLLADPTKPMRSRAVKTRERVAGWVRKLGVSDKAVSPLHAWRHTFKQRAARAGMTERISDFITGHAPATVGRGYGEPTLADMAEALRTFPRYVITSVA